MASGNEIVHVSLGDAANRVTSHLTNLQGLAATSPCDGSGGDGASAASLCDPSVTHGVAPLDGGHYVHVPRCLVVDGRDAFGTDSGSVGGDAVARNRHWGPAQPQPHHDPENLQVPSWSGPVRAFDPSDHSILFGDRPGRDDGRRPAPPSNHRGEDPLERFRDGASIMGLSPVHSRFNAAPPTPRSSYDVGAGGSSGRHVQWDEDEEEDDYCYGQDEERIREEKRRQLERTERRDREVRRTLGASMEEAWEEAFYQGRGGEEGGDNDNGGSRQDAAIGASIGSNEASGDNDTTTNSSTPSAASKSSVPEREIQWHDYWMPPIPSPSRYKVVLPFDTRGNSADGNDSSTWSSSFRIGYQPGAAGVGSDSTGITKSWRDDALSESLRKVLEGCDTVRGFNVLVDGGSSYGSALSSGGGRSSCGPNNIAAGGGFHAGLASSLLEELAEECRSAGRFAVTVDSPSFADGTGDETGGCRQIHQRNFRRRLNAGLALHGLSTNADAFLPVSMDGAYRALRGGGEHHPQSSNRALFEGSAAVALALEASTLPYRLRDPGTSRRSRMGIQSGFYQGCGGNVDDKGMHEPYATAPSLTYREFLACARPSSDGRRSILELDALLHPLPCPSAGGGQFGSGGQVGGSLPPSVLASLASAGLIGNANASDVKGELHKRMMRGTSVERMRMEQQRQQHRRSRGVASSASRHDQGPGEWLDDASMVGGGGLLTSLSGNSIPFGRRADHHHFALLSSLRPAASDVCGLASPTTAFLRLMMESMGIGYRPEASVGLVVEDTLLNLTGDIGSYWRCIFAERRRSSVDAVPTAPSTGTTSGSSGGGNNPFPKQQSPKQHLASRTPVLSVLGNSTRSYPRLRSVSSGFIDALQSRSNAGYLSRDVMAGVVPEKDDCVEALEYCRELVDVYEPPLGSGLVGGGENDDVDAYFDVDEEWPEG